MLTRSPLPGRLCVFLAVVFLALFVQTKPVSADAIIIYDFTGQITQQTGINVGLGSSTQPPGFAGSITYTVPGGGGVTNLSPFARAYDQPNGNIFATVFGSDGTPYPMGLNYPTQNEPNAAVPQLTLSTSTNQLNYTFQIANGADAWLTASLPTGETVGPTKMSLTVSGINSLDLGQLNLLSFGHDSRNAADPGTDYRDEHHSLLPDRDAEHSDPRPYFGQCSSDRRPDSQLPGTGRTGVAGQQWRDGPGLLAQAAPQSVVITLRVMKPHHAERDDYTNLPVCICYQPAGRMQAVCSRRGLAQFPSGGFWQP